MLNHYIRIVACSICILFLFGCMTDQSPSATGIIQDAQGRFQINDTCLTLDESSSASVRFGGTILYDESDIKDRNGVFGLHWIGDDQENIGIIPVDSFEMISSPNGKAVAFMGIKQGETISDKKIYILENAVYSETGFNDWGQYPVWTENNLLMGTVPDVNNKTVKIIINHLDDKSTEWKTVSLPEMLSNISKISNSGFLSYNWYKKAPDGAKLAVIDINTGKQIAAYADVTYKVIPLWGGYKYNLKGNRILTISSNSPYQQELWEIDIEGGGDPVQVTDFHSKYPFALIYYDFSWSPSNQWFVGKVLLSPTKNAYDDVAASSQLFLIDLEKSTGFVLCRQIAADAQTAVIWSPDSKYFALSIEDKIWVIDPLTLKSRLLVDRKGVPVTVMGWTIP